MKLFFFQPVKMCKKYDSALVRKSLETPGLNASCSDWLAWSRLMSVLVSYWAVASNS